MAYQLLATLIAYIFLYGLILFIGNLSDVKKPINSRHHMVRVAFRLAVVIIAVATPCLFLGAHPLLIIGFLLVLPIITAGPLGFSPLGLPTLLIYGWVTMPPGTTVMSQLTHHNDPSNESFKRLVTDVSLDDQTGMTTTVLRPHGKVQINGKSYEAKAQVGLIDASRLIRVIRSENELLIVEEKQQENDLN